jgi:hypothetical protein
MSKFGKIGLMDVVEVLRVLADRSKRCECCRDQEFPCWDCKTRIAVGESYSSLVARLGDCCRSCGGQNYMRGKQIRLCISVYYATGKPSELLCNRCNLNKNKKDRYGRHSVYRPKPSHSISSPLY